MVEEEIKKNVSRVGSSLGSTLFIMILMAVLSYFTYGTWNYAWPVIAFGFLTTLFTIAVMLVPIGGTVLGILYIVLWSNNLLVALALPASWITGVIIWFDMILGIIFNIFWSIFIIRFLVKKYKGTWVSTKTVTVKIEKRE